jgi:hypothetical protein
VLFKSGDASDPNRWRGIMLLDSVVKIVSSVISARLQDVLKEVGCEYQNGFTSRRGCADGLFSLKMALQKRKEHDLETYLLFIDLVKAFDTVPRASLWKVLSKYGVPPHLVKVIMELNTNCSVKLDVDGEDIDIMYTIGVKQGDNLAPILFLFYIQAAIDSLEKKWPCSKPQFSTAEDAIFTGRDYKTNAESCRLINAMKFYMWCSLYADDAALIFESKADLETGSRLIYDHLERFGLRMHVGTPSNPTKSKSVFMFIHKASGLPNDGDRAPILNVGPNAGVVPNVRKFKYLGSTIHESLNDNTDVASNIGKATAAFNLLRKCLFASKDVQKAEKVTFYEGLILAVLLYASECWTTYAVHLARIARFHNDCARVIAGVSRHTQWRHRVPMSRVLKKAGLLPITTYIARRKLRWAGHVLRMDQDRLPRKFLSSWIEKPRKPNGQWLTWGRALQKEMDRAGIERDTWSIRARNRPDWRKGSRNANFEPRKKMTGAIIEVYYPVGKIPGYQPTRNIRNRRFTTIIDEDTAGWYAGLVTSETTDAIGHITIRVRFPPPDTCPYEFVLKKGVLSSVSKKLRWRYDESNDEHDLLNRGI